jgi:3-hydroxyacyl-[acyl-carrier-protein] dehydratase
VPVVSRSLVPPTPLFSNDALDRLLPHRPPFRFVDRVIRFEPGQFIVAELDLRPGEPHFAGHFPGRPLMPGVLVAEALAQTSGLLLGLTSMQSDPAPPDLYLAAAQLKFTDPAKPGETLELHARADHHLGGLFLFQVTATAAGRAIATGTITLTGRLGGS